MRAVWTILALAALAGCSGGASGSDDLHARQEAACTATIAAHIEQPPAAVTSVWQSQSDGVAKVEARDGARLHVCDVDSSGRVLGYVHPGT